MLIQTRLQGRVYMKWLAIILMLTSFNAISAISPPVTNPDITDEFIERCTSTFKPSNTLCHQYFNYKKESIYFGQNKNNSVILKSVTQNIGIGVALKNLGIESITISNRNYSGSSTDIIEQEAYENIISLLNALNDNKVFNSKGISFTPNTMTSFGAREKVVELIGIGAGVVTLSEFLPNFGLFDDAPTYVAIACDNNDRECFSVVEITDGEPTKVITESSPYSSNEPFIVIGEEARKEIMSAILKLAGPSCTVSSESSEVPCPAGAPSDRVCYVISATVDCD